MTNPPFDPSRFVPAEEIDDDVMEMLGRGKRANVTPVFHAVWYALDKPHIAMAVQHVQAILLDQDDDDGHTMGIVYAVNPMIWPTPEAMSPEDNEAMLVATMSFLRGIGAEVVREEGTQILRARFGNGPQIKVAGTPFDGDVDEFVSEMEETLGPSAVKNDPDDPMARWYR